MGFDFDAGWSTAQTNVAHDDSPFEIAAQAGIIIGVGIATSGAMGWLGYGGVGLVPVVATAAAVGATTSIASGLMHDNLSIKNVLRGALSGALTAGLLNGLGTVLGPLEFAGKVAAGTAVQGLVQAALGGSFKDGALAGFASALGQEVASQMLAGIDAALVTNAMSPMEAAAAKTFARMVGSAIRAVATPGDPNQAFASAFLGDVLGQIDVRPAGQPGPVGQPQVDENGRAEPVPVLPANPVAPTSPTTSTSPTTPTGAQAPANPETPGTPTPATLLWIAADGREVFRAAAATAPVGTLLAFDDVQPPYPNPSLLPANARVTALLDEAGVVYWRVSAAGVDTLVSQAAAPSYLDVLQLERVVVVVPRMTAEQIAANTAAALRASTALASAALVGEVWTLEALMAQGAHWFGRALAGLGELAELVPEIGLRTAGVAVSSLTLPGNAGQSASRIEIGDNQRLEVATSALYGVLQQRDEYGDWPCTGKTASTCAAATGNGR